MTEKDKETRNDDQTENFTKVDPNSLPDELKDIYKSLQADYTKKTQSLAEMRKEWEKEKNQLMDQLKVLGAYENEIQRWRTWYEELEKEANAGEITDPNRSNDLDNLLDDATNSNSDPGSTSDATKQIAALKKEIEALTGQLSSLHEAIKTTDDRTARMFTYQSQLSDLEKEYAELAKSLGKDNLELDRVKLLQYAKEHGITDLKRAYQEVYADDIIEKRARDRLRELEQERRTRGIHSTGRKVVFKPSSEKPRSFSEATEQVLNELSKDGMLGM